MGVDSCHLQLQNLLYEVLHLQKEVTKCLQYKSADEDMDLAPLEEFYRDAPDDIKNEEKIQDNPHSLRLARLEYERLQRQTQSEEFHCLEKEKEALESHISKKQENLASLKPHLSNMLHSTEPVENASQRTTRSNGKGQIFAITFVRVILRNKSL